MRAKPNPIKKINILYARCLDIVAREVEALYQASIGGKLSMSEARDLRDYTKLLKDMKNAHEAIVAERVTQAEAAAKAIPDEDLRKAVVGS